MRMRYARWFSKRIGIGALLLGLAGCARTEPARFYTLSPLPGGQGSGAKPCLTLGLGPVTLPHYLDRPQIVTQTGSNEMKLADFDQWTEPVDRTFVRILGENLSALLCVEEVIEHPWKGSEQVDVQLTVNVARFHGMADGTAILQAQWTLSKDLDDKTVVKRQSKISVPIEGSGYGALVAAQSRALEKLSMEIAAEIRAISR